MFLPCHKSTIMTTRMGTQTLYTVMVDHGLIKIGQNCFGLRSLPNVKLYGFTMFFLLNAYRQNMFLMPADVLGGLRS